MQNDVVGQRMAPSTFISIPPLLIRLPLVPIIKFFYPLFKSYLSVPSDLIRVCHLGDTNVPNSFFFLTKYLSVAPILNPIVLCLEKIDEVAKDDDLRAYLNAKGGPENVKKEILLDFFRSGFDGSGGTNFFDSGSCLDGRLTSAWNWCNQIEKKPFFPVFLLTGFVGFDGEA